MTTTGHGPTVRRRMLGRRLRELREQAGVSLVEAAEAIRGSTSKLSRLETGQSPFRDRDVEDLLTRYGVTGARERRAVLDLVRQANTRGWWRDYDDEMPSWLSTYIDLEDAASLIRAYEVQLVSGLLQTEEYARAVISRGYTGGDDRWIDDRIRLRMTRQQLLTRPDAPDLWMVIDEAALRRTVGGPEVMRAQIERLIELSKLPTITLQVMPFSAGLHSADGGAFTLLRFAEPELPDVVYVERLNSGLLLDRRDDVEQYSAAMDRLSIESATPHDTVEILTALLSEVG